MKRPRTGGKAHWFLPVLLAAIAAGGIVLTPGATENARANGDTRTIYLHHAHTKESIAATFMVDGQYDSAVLDQLNHFLRDWRRDETTHMDPRLFDVIWTVYRESGSAQPIEVMSAYRSPETNAMLRRRSRLVAEHSQHILGKAMDQHYVDVPMSRIRELAMKLQRGGVGFYPTAGTPFVHMDVGGVRHWPRMTYDQLARVFPDGKTVHIPSNGQPLARYEEARAELEARGDSFNYPTVTEVKSKGFFAWLFGGGEDEADTESAAQAKGGRRAQQRVASIDPAASGSIAAGVSGMSSKDGGARAFYAAAAPPPPSSFGGLPQRRAAPAPPLAPAPAPVLQAVTEPPPAAVAEQPKADAQAELSLALAEQERVRQAAFTAPVADTLQAAKLPAAIIDPSTVPTVPMPPRRPVELASPGPNAPLPPGRPVQVAALLQPPAHAPAMPPPKDAIAALIGATIPSRTAGLPAAIVHGAGTPKTAIAPQVMAFAAPIASLPVARSDVPLPAPRPAFVAARLDRSNFRALTGNEDTRGMPARSGMGSAVGALRSAAKSNLGTLSGQASPGANIGFGNRATDLATDRFTGSAVKPREHVVTSAGSSRRVTSAE